MFCDKCGKELPENANFCSFCGKKINKLKGVLETSNKPSRLVSSLDYYDFGVSLSPEVKQEIITEIKAKHKVASIKILREHTGMGLIQAKSIIDRYM